MQSRKLNILYMLFFFVAIFVFGIAIFEDQIRVRIRATSSVVSSDTSVLLVDKVAAGINKDSIRVTVFARNATGDTLNGVTVQVQATLGTVQPSSMTTDVMGKAVFTLSSAVGGKSIITATVANQPLPQKLTILFSSD
ncbi:MAG: Ig-like domain-containing protein [Candidatus Roizmanbacteria bacterium]|nr:Ig-like domain-containing protein [Candidatus Roizmanbacteria bacterium]